MILLSSADIEQFQNADDTTVDVDGQSGPSVTHKGKKTKSKETLDTQTAIDTEDGPADNGRTALELLYHISILCTNASGSKHFVRCLGEQNGKRCPKSWVVPRSRGRILGHAAGCQLLPQHLRHKAGEKLSAESPGARVEAIEQKEAEASSGRSAAPTTSTQPSVAPVFAAAGRDQLGAKLDFAVTKLFCVGGIAPNIADRLVWREMWTIASPSYQPPCSTTLSDSLIPKEAARVRQMQYDLLSKETNIALSFDGNSIRKPQSVYTIHATTALRRTFFLEGIEASDVSHTGEWITGNLLTVGFEVYYTTFCS